MSNSPFYLKVGDLVEVTEPFYWYEDERHEIGGRFTIEEQHLKHGFENYVKVIEAANNKGGKSYE